MSIYFANIIIVILGSVIYNWKIKGFKGQIVDGKKLYGLVVCGSFTFIMALRDMSVGVDTGPYSRIFNIIADASSFMDAIRRAPMTAPAYVAFCRALSYISKDPRSVIIVSALIINIGLMHLVNQASSNAAVSYLSWIGLTLFYCSMNGTRQCIALVLALQALVMLSNNIKNMKGWGFLVIATLVHSTALILLFAIGGIILTEKIYDNKKIFFISSTASLIIALGYGPGVGLALRFIPGYSMYVLDESKYSIFNSTGGGRIVLLYVVLLAIVMLWMFKAPIASENEKGFVEKMLPAVLFGAIFGIINSKNILINRLLWYYLGIYTLFIPDALVKYKKNKRIILTIGITIVLFGYSVLSLKENQNGVVPYRFFW